MTNLLLPEAGLLCPKAKQGDNIEQPLITQSSLQRVETI